MMKRFWQALSSDDWLAACAGESRGREAMVLASSATPACFSWPATDASKDPRSPSYRSGGSAFAFQLLMSA